MKATPNSYNLIVEIKPEKKTDLKKVLADIQADLYSNPVLPFAGVTSIHFARFVILDKTAGPDPYPDQLVFSSNYSGSLNEHLTEILNCPNSRVDKIFNCCKNYPENQVDQIAWLKRNAELRAYFYRGNWGLTSRQIEQSEKLRKLAEDHIDSISDLDLTALELREEIAKKVKESDDYKPAPIYQAPKFPILKLVILVVVLIPFLPLLIILAVLFIAILRFHELRDEEFDTKYSNAEQTRTFVEQEDKIVQNQLTHLVEIKPGWFRLFSLKLVLNAIAFLAKYLFNKGNLGGIPSIHYARWIIIDKGKRLLFFSNFDGSWESYLGDFVDKAAIGLTAVWSNTVQFPKTKFLIKNGARDEQRFKSWARSKQIRTNVWYSAYPHLTVTNILNNKNIHSGISHDLSEEENEEWLLKY